MGVPRFVFNDFPLGNSCGKPHDIESQNRIIDLAFDSFRSAKAPRTTIHSNIVWSEDNSWKTDCYNTSKWTEEDKRKKRKEFEIQKTIAKSLSSGLDPTS